MRRQITASVRAGESTIRVAERLLDQGEPIVRIPRHVRELKEAARLALETGDKNIYLRAVDKWRGTVDRLGEGISKAAGQSTVRSATQQLVKDLGKAKIEQIDQVVDRWTLDRARHQARVIARTETTEGFRDVYRKSTVGQPYTKGYRWVLSGGHPKPDVCDVYAEQDLHGLGPGGYPADKVPATPHPHDLCSQIAIIDNDHFKREIAKARGTREPPKPFESGKKQSGAAWLKSKPGAFQLSLLGPTRFKLFQQGRKVLDAQGKPIPVFRVLGRPRPTTILGPPVRAKGIIKTDRSNMAQPFPSVEPVS